MSPKGDLIAHYREIAPVMLPYLIDRPQVLHRHVDGYLGKEFFQRVSRQCPTWIHVEKIVTATKTRDYHLCQDWPTLLWLANFGCIEFIPWSSRVGSGSARLHGQGRRSGRIPFHRVVEADQAVHTIRGMVMNRRRSRGAGASSRL